MLDKVDAWLNEGRYSQPNVRLPGEWRQANGELNKVWIFGVRGNREFEKSDENVRQNMRVLDAGEPLIEALIPKVHLTMIQS